MAIPGSRSRSLQSLLFTIYLNEVLFVIDFWYYGQFLFLFRYIAERRLNTRSLYFWLSNWLVKCSCWRQCNWPHRWICIGDILATHVIVIWWTQRLPLRLSCCFRRSDQKSFLLDFYFFNCFTIGILTVQIDHWV